MTEQLVARQRLRIEGLVRQNRVHQFENPLIEDLDFVSYDEGDPNTIDEPRVTTALDISLVETILNAETGALVAGRPNLRSSARSTGPSCGATANGCSTRSSSPARAPPHEGAARRRRLRRASPEMVLRERYARDEITLEEFEAEMAQFLRSRTRPTRSVTVAVDRQEMTSAVMKPRRAVVMA